MASLPATRQQYNILLFISYIIYILCAFELYDFFFIYFICGLCMYNDVGITDLLLFDLVLYNDIMLMASARSLCS